MHVNVKFFAILRDRAGVGQTSLELPAQATVSAAVEALAGQFPHIRQPLQRAAFAVNHSYVHGDRILNDGDELALIPPVSGGSGRFGRSNRCAQ